MEAVPLLPSVAALAHDKIGTGAAGHNWASYGGAMQFDPALPDWAQAVLCDPQTSGGLLIAVAPNAAAQILALLKSCGFALAVKIGHFVAGEPRIVVR